MNVLFYHFIHSGLCYARSYFQGTQDLNPHFFESFYFSKISLLPWGSKMMEDYPIFSESPFLEISFNPYGMLWTEPELNQTICSGIFSADSFRWTGMDKAFGYDGRKLMTYSYHFIFDFTQTTRGKNLGAILTYHLTRNPVQCLKRMTLNPPLFWKQYPWKMIPPRTIWYHKQLLRYPPLSRPDPHINPRESVLFRVGLAPTVHQNML